jgi:hypothetical protein
MCCLLVAGVLAGTPLALANGDAADQAMSTIRPEAIRADIRFLSDDLLEGRGTATRGYQIGAKFIATQLEGLGLQPAGDAGTYFQNVPMRSLKVDQAASTFSLTRDAKTQTLAFGKDFVAFADPGRSESSVEAPLVFVGYGVTAPGQNYDDYKSIDEGSLLQRRDQGPERRRAWCRRRDRPRRSDSGAQLSLREIRA